VRAGFNKAAYLYVLYVVNLAACGPAGEVAEDSAALPGSSRLAVLLGAGADDGFPRATDPRDFRFPDDHGPHEEFRNEWWYFTGNLDSAEGFRYGYELTLFRFALAPEPVPGVVSGWRTNQVYVGHLAVTDVAAERFRYSDRYSRGAIGLAGATSSPVRVWLDDWQVSADTAGRWQLRARHDELAIELELEPVKSPVLNGDRGRSQKSADPGNASYYYSVPRLVTRGMLSVDGRGQPVTGLSWLDREWGSSALAPEQQGWDWFALQLSDGSELMFYVLRGSDGRPDSYSSGTRVDADGRYGALAAGDVVIDVISHWDSGRGGRYPAAWNIRIPGEQLALDVVPVVSDQELATTVRYWEGAVDVSGIANGNRVTGRGYVELTGYAGQ